MHFAANNFQRVNPIAHLELLNEPWPTERARLHQTLNVLEFAVVASKAQFPSRIEQEFDVVLTNIRASRSRLDEATFAADALVKSGNLLHDGQFAFGDASDLIGDACNVRLAADPSLDSLNPTG